MVSEDGAFTLTSVTRGIVKEGLRMPLRYVRERKNTREETFLSACVFYSPLKCGLMGIEDIAEDVDVRD